MAAGFGIQIENPGFATVNGIPLRQPGTVNTFNSTGFRNANMPFADILSFLTSGFFANAINVTLPAEKLEMPMAHHYSFIFEQQISRNFSLSTGYVGTSGRKLLRFTTPNLGSGLTVVPTSIGPAFSFAPNFPQTRGVLYVPRRPLDRTNAVGDLESLGAVNQFETTAESNYSSLQTQLRGRFINSLNFQLSYTFSKATDDVSDVFDLAGASALAQNGFDLAAERGPANFDIRHRVAYDLAYSFPKYDGNAFVRHFTSGLQLATTGRYHSGQPFTVNSVIDINLDGNLTDRLNTLAGLEITGNRAQPLRLYDNKHNIAPRAIRPRRPNRPQHIPRRRRARTRRVRYQKILARLAPSWASNRHFQFHKPS